MEEKNNKNFKLGLCAKVLQSVLVVEGPYVLSRRRRDPNASMVAVAITRLPRMCMPSPSFVVGVLLVMLSPPAQTTPRRGRPGLPRGVRLETLSTAVRSKAMQMPECGFAANELSVCTPTARQTMRREQER